MPRRLPREAREALYAVKAAEWGTRDFRDGDVMLAAREAQGRGLAPSEFFELIEHLERQGYLTSEEGQNRHGYVTDYVQLTHKGYQVVEA